MSAGNTFVYAKASTEGGDLHCFRNDDGTVLLLQNMCQVLGVPIVWSLYYLI